MDPGKTDTAGDTPEPAAHAAARASRRAPSALPSKLPSRSILLTPLVHLAALLLLAESWTWQVGSRAGAWLAASRPLRWLEHHIRVLPPWAALGAFALPGLVLLPVKLLALVAIAQGHVLSGLATFAAAKLGGAVVVARIYVLTVPTLLTLGWFARWHGGFMALQERWLAILRDSNLWRRIRAAVSSARRGLRRMLRHTRRQPSHLTRVLRRFSARFRARQQAQRDEATETESS